MKRRLLYRIGRVLDIIGYTLARPWERLGSYGMSLWDANCNCIHCQERARKET